MLVFECPSCQTKLQAAEADRGKTIICAKCQTAVTVPVPADAAAAAITAEPALATGVTTPGKGGAKARKRWDDDDDRPDGFGKAKAGMGIGMILLIVGGSLGCCVCLTGTLAGLLVPAIQKVRGAAEKTQAMNNMKQIALAGHNHHDAMQFFPPPRMANAELSWRVTILPFVEQGGLFNQIDQTHAWNAPANSRFINGMPPVYQGPKLDVPEFSKTHYQYFTGPNTLFPTPLTQVGMAQIPDGTSNTLFFAEALSPVEWLKPADMAVPPNGALPLPPETFLAAMCDGSVRIIDRRRADDNTLRLLINPKDGQVIPAGALD